MTNIFISDVSLKEFNRTESLTLSFKEKLEIAKKLSELNVDAIEIGPVTLDKADEVLIKTVCACVTKSIISCAVGNSEQSVEKNFGLIANAKKKRLIVSVPVSPVQMEYSWQKKPKAVLELLIALTKKAVALNDDVEVALEDATRAEPQFLYQAVKSAIECGAKTITVSDLTGQTLPEDFAKFIKDLKDNVEELKGVRLCVQTADDYSLATANMLSAIKEGATGVKLCAMAGTNFPSLEGFASALEFIGAKKGYSCNLNKTGVSRIVKQIAQISADKSSNTAFDNVVGERAEALNKNITLSALSKLIKKRGYELSGEDLEKVFEEVKRLSKKKDVNTKELDVIIASTALQVPATYELLSFSVQSSNLMPAMAGVVLQKDGVEISGLSYGNGSIDAAFLALETVTGRHFDLDDFEVIAVTEGKEAMGQTLVKLRSNGKLYSGRGVSTDIVGASIRAYVNALNKIVYEEGNR